MECGSYEELFFPMSAAPTLGSLVVDQECRVCQGRRWKRTLENLPNTQVLDDLGTYEQVWYDNGDGKTITVEPAAKNLKRGGRKTLPKSTPLPKGPGLSGKQARRIREQQD